MRQRVEQRCTNDAGKGRLKLIVLARRDNCAHVVDALLRKEKTANDASDSVLFRLSFSLKKITLRL